MTSRTGEARGGFREILKKSVSWELDTERDGWHSFARGNPCGGCCTCWGGEDRWKSQNRKIVPLSLCRRTFKLKVNKKVRTWTKKSLRVFRISRSYVLCIYVMNVPCTFCIFMYMTVVQYQWNGIIQIFCYRIFQDYKQYSKNFPRACTLDNWFFLEIYEVCIHLHIS